MERDSHTPHGPEQTPEERRLRAEIIERLPDTPEQPSPYAVEVIGAMMSACLHAHSEGQPLPEEDARSIAHFLSLGVDDGTALRSFADGKPVEMRDVRAEYLELASRPNVYPETRAIIDWLGNYTLSASYPELEPAAPEGDRSDWQHPVTFKEDLGLTVAFHVRGTEWDVREDEALMGRVERLALDHGTAGLAFLRLPTTDATRADLDAAFARSYVNSYDAIETFLAAHFRLFRIEDDQSTTPVPFDELSADRQEELYAQAGQHVALVEVAGRVHVFKRNHHATSPPGA